MTKAEKGTVLEDMALEDMPNGFKFSPQWIRLLKRDIRSQLKKSGSEFAVSHQDLKKDAKEKYSEALDANRLDCFISIVADWISKLLSRAESDDEMEYVINRIIDNIVYTFFDPRDSRIPDLILKAALVHVAKDRARLNTKATESVRGRVGNVRDKVRRCTEKRR